MTKLMYQYSTLYSCRFSISIADTHFHDILNYSSYSLYDNNRCVIIIQEKSFKNYIE